MIAPIHKLPSQPYSGLGSVPVERCTRENVHGLIAHFMKYVRIFAPVHVVKHAMELHIS